MPVPEEGKVEDVEILVSYNKEYVDKNGCPAFEAKENRIVQEKGEGDRDPGLEKRIIGDAQFEEQLLAKQQELRVKLAGVR